MAERGRISIDRERCKGCGLCAAFCPRGVISLAPEINSRGYHPAVVVEPAACTGCAGCARMCPDVAIAVERVDAA